MEIKADHRLMTAEEISEVAGHLRAYGISRIGSVTEKRLRELIPRLEHHAEALAFSEGLKTLAPSDDELRATVRDWDEKLKSQEASSSEEMQLFGERAKQ